MESRAEPTFAQQAIECSAARDADQLASSTQWTPSWVHLLGVDVWQHNLAPVEATLVALALFRSRNVPPVVLAFTVANLLSRPKAEVQLLKLTASPRVGSHLCYKLRPIQGEDVIRPSPALVLTRCPCPQDHHIQQAVNRPLPDRAAAVAYGANLQMLDAIWKSAEESGEADVLMAVASDALCAAIAGCHAEIVRWLLGNILQSHELLPVLSSPSSIDFIFVIFAGNIPYSIAAHRRWHLGLQLLQDAGAPTAVPIGVSSPIAIAARGGDVKTLKRVLELGFDVKTAYHFHHSYTWKNTPVTCDPLIASLKNPELTMVLLKAGADPHQSGKCVMSSFELCTGLLKSSAEKLYLRYMIPRSAPRSTFVEAAMKMVVAAGKKTTYRESGWVRNFYGEDDWGGYTSSEEGTDEEPVPEYSDSRQADLHERRLNKGRHRKLQE